MDVCDYNFTVCNLPQDMWKCEQNHFINVLKNTRTYQFTKAESIEFDKRFNYYT